MAAGLYVMAAMQAANHRHESFQSTAKNTTVTNDGILKAQLKDSHDDYVDASLDLNSCLGIDNGQFHWGGRNISQHAQNLRIEYDNDVLVLCAELVDSQGQSHTAKFKLGEKISNMNGRFAYF